MFSRGDIVAHRDLQEGKIWFAHAVIVLEDSSARIQLYWGPGSDVRAPSSPAGEPVRLPTQQWELRPRPRVDHHVLCVAWPGVAHSVWLLWREDWVFTRWYVNLQSPFTRTALGFDATDDILDIDIEPDHSWSWKDEGELARMVDAQLFTPRRAAEIRAEGMRAIGRAARGQEPFTQEWVQWRPEPSWPIPELPAGWDLR